MNPNVTDDLLNCELSKICDWLGANKIALNVSKTKYVVFHTANKHVAYPKLNINGNNIERVTNFKLNFKFYFFAVLENLYNALITPHFNYCILCWGSVVKENHSLHILQKRALRLITNSNYISHTEPLCKELRVLKLICEDVSR